MRLPRSDDVSVGYAGPSVCRERVSLVAPAPTRPSSAATALLATLCVPLAMPSAGVAALPVAKRRVTISRRLSLRAQEL